MREDSDFFSEHERCAAWLFRPESDDHGSESPIVVMAHGFAGQRSFRLPDYARQFAERGLATLVFDYRHFGDSEGQPRNLVDHRRQQRDWNAAIAHARAIPGIDPRRLGLWGASYSGGHVISLAAADPDIGAIVAQAPMVDGVTAIRIGVKFTAAALWHAARDYGRATLGMSPHYIPIVATPDRFAALNQPGCDEGYRRLVPDDSNWVNECTARSLLTTLWFRPGRKASRVSCPAMVVVAEHDQVLRSSVIKKVATQMPRAEVIHYEVDHFGVFEGEFFDEISERQADFFARHLKKP